VEKKEAEPPEVSKPAKVKSEKPTEPPDPNVTADAAPPTEVTSEASMETTLTPTAAEKNPAENKPEEAKEEAVDEPMETSTKPVVEDTPATDTPPPPIAAKASPILEPGGHKPGFKDVVTTHVVTPEQNRKPTKNNQAAQVQETYSKVGASLTDDDDAFTERAFPFNPDPIGPISDDTKVLNMHETAAGAVNEPKVVEPFANAAQASMPSYEANTMARPETDPPDVAAQDRDSWSPWTSCP
jgi:hypothetical protein